MKNNNVKRVAKYLGWSKPMFMDEHSGKYTCKWMDDFAWSKEAEEVKALEESISRDLGIEVKIKRSTLSGHRTISFDPYRRVDYLEAYCTSIVVPIVDDDEKLAW